MCTPLYVEGFMGERRVYGCPGDQPNPPQIFQTPQPMYHSSSEPPLIICREGGESFRT